MGRELLSDVEFDQRSGNAVVLVLFLFLVPSLILRLVVLVLLSRALVGGLFVCVIARRGMGNRPHWYAVRCKRERFVVCSVVTVEIAAL